MKPTIIVTLLLYATPVDAKCYSVWRYPYPQNCRAIAYAPLKRMASSNVLPPPRAVPAVVDIPLPELDGVWATPLDTKEGLEMLQGMQRLKALRSLQTGD